jgi:hypothetical protein
MDFSRSAKKDLGQPEKALNLRGATLSQDQNGPHLYAGPPANLPMRGILAIIKTH